MTFPVVKLGAFLRQRSAFIQIDDLTTYKRARVQLHGRGIVLRDQVVGSEIKTKKQQVARAGEFLVAEIDAKVGGFGVVPPDLDGAIVSSHYFLFEIDSTRCLKEWLEAYVHSDLLEAQVTAQGSTNYAAIRPAQVLGFEMPLPPLPEQRRIVGRIEALTRKLDEVQRLHGECTEKVGAIGRAMLRGSDRSVSTPMRELARLREPDVAVEATEMYQFAGVYCFGRGVFRAQRRRGDEFSYPRLTRLRTGDFVYPKLMAWEGAFGIVPPACNGFVVSTEFPVFEVLGDRVLPEVLATYFQDPVVWPAISGASTGTNVRRRRLNPTDFLSHRIPLPPRETQERLASVHKHLGAVAHLKEDLNGKLEALLPSLLNRALALQR